jgi:hypothetical protein
MTGPRIFGLEAPEEPTRSTCSVSGRHVIRGQELIATRLGRTAATLPGVNGQVDAGAP